MKKIVYVCDSCGNDIDEAFRYRMVYGKIDDPPTEKDLCIKCYLQVTTGLFGIKAGNDIPESLKEKPNPEPKKRGGARHKVELDLGKVGALYAAGWSVKQIAEEMNCSDQTIRNHLNEAVQSYKDVMEEK